MRYQYSKRLHLHDGACVNLPSIRGPEQQAERQHAHIDDHGPIHRLGGHIFRAGGPEGEEDADDAVGEGEDDDGDAQAGAELEGPVEDLFGRGGETFV